MAIVGYIAQVLNVPPLVFRFQIPPDLLSEKSRYGYTSSQGMGKWGFDQAKAGGVAGGLTGAIGWVTGLKEDAKEWGSLITNTRGLAPGEGEPRTFDLEFDLWAGGLPKQDEGGALDDKVVDDEIEPYLALLRAFMVPGVDPFAVIKDLASKSPPCFNTPPEVSFKYGPISATCVMTDLNIKILAFTEEGKAKQAKVNLTLKEQTHSFDPVVEAVMRTATIIGDMGRDGYAEDLLLATPVVGTIANLFM